MSLKLFEMALSGEGKRTLSSGVSMDSIASSSVKSKKKHDKDDLKSKSKKRHREAENGEGEPELKKKASKGLESTEGAKNEMDSGNKRSWGEILSIVLYEQLVKKGVGNVLKLGAEKNGHSSFGANSSPTDPSGTSTLLSHDNVEALECNSSQLTRDLVWQDELEPLKKDGVLVRIHRLFSRVEAARWMCLHWHETYNTFAWTFKTMIKIQAEIEAFNSIIKKKSIKISPALQNLLASLTELSTGSLAKSITSLQIASTQAANLSLSNDATSLNERMELNQTRIVSLAALDNLYYLLYHYTLVSPITSTGSSKSSSSSKPEKSSTKKKFSIPAPAEYFRSFLDPVMQEVGEMVAAFWKAEVDRVTRERTQKACGTLESALASSMTNPLLAIWYLRFYEYVRLFYATGWAKHSREMDNAIVSAGQTGITGKRISSIKRVKQKQLSKENSSEPISGEVLQLWRDVSRDWPSLLYAYAVPTSAALQTIQQYAPVLEVGAGTGYWAHLLKNQGIQITAVDSVPTTTEGEQNEYHANVPPFFPVSKGGTQVVRKNATSSLFLCFPPPEDTMALDALRLYTGQHVIHVGEWEGFTGSTDFEKMLFSQFELIERNELPNWQDTSYDLTVWRRKAGVRSTSPTSNAFSENHRNLTTMQCFTCGKVSAVLRRCRCCRVVAFCSKACATAGARQHSSCHALKGVFLSDVNASLDYNHRKHYRLLRTKDL